VIPSKAKSGSLVNVNAANAEELFACMCTWTHNVARVFAAASEDVDLNDDGPPPIKPKLQLHSTLADEDVNHNGVHSASDYSVDDSLASTPAEPAHAPHIDPIPAATVPKSITMAHMPPQDLPPSTVPQSMSVDAGLNSVSVTAQRTLMYCVEN
jgi:hypothetical protein